jgi:hypothetical protein
MEPEFTIANDYDPDGDMSTNADPMAEFLTYLSHVRGAAVRDIGFTLVISNDTLRGYAKTPKGKDSRRVVIRVALYLNRRLLPFTALNS